MPNLRLAFRSLRSAPVVTVVAILSLALGMGANAAIFSVFDQLIRRPLPVPDPRRLVNLVDRGPRAGSVSTNDSGSEEAVFSYPMFRDLERDQAAFAGLAGHRGFGANLAFGGESESGEGQLVSGEYFPALGLLPALGRLLGKGDDETPGAHPVAVLAHHFWSARFAADPGVVGQTIRVNGQPLSIVGVAPRGFTGTTLGQRPQVFVPLVMRAQMVPGWNGYAERRDYWLYLFGRLRPGDSSAAAAGGVNTLYRGIISGVETALQTGMSESNLERFRSKELALEPGAHGQGTMRRESRGPILLLLGVTGFVLLIGCANVANLLLARAAARANEMALRLALGAQRRALFLQLLAEAGLLAAAAGAAGILVARGTLALLVALLPPENGIAAALRLDRTALLFLMLLALGSGVLFGLFPALFGARRELATVLRGASAGGAGARGARRFRTVLATGQIALAMALLLAALLFTRSLANVARVDLGFDIEQLVTFGLSPDLDGYSPGEILGFYQRVEDAVAATPGVTHVVASMVPLIAGSSWGSNVSVEGFAAEPDTDTNARYNQVGPGFFAAFGAPLLLGREFTRGDHLTSPKVAIVNETFARKFGLWPDPVGKRMKNGRGGELDIEIVGLAPDTKYNDLKLAVPPQFFLPYRQDQRLGASSFYVRSALPPAELVRSLRATIAGLDPNLPIENLRPMPAQVRESVFADRLIVTLAGAFALLATLLAAVGLYGVLAYTVAQRTREIGLRMALGADAGRVRALVLRQVVLMTALGGTLGLVTGWLLGRLGQALLFELEPHDPAVLLAAALAITAVSLGAGALPAQRAARVVPIEALRAD